MPFPIDIVYERQWSSLGNLVEALTRLDRMGRLYGGFPKFRYTRAGIPAGIIRTFPVASLWNFAAGKTKLPAGFYLDEPKWVGNWVARHDDLAPVVWANGTAHRFLFPRIKDSGRTLILERGSTHPEDLFRLPQVARKEAGYPYSFDLPHEALDEMEKTPLADWLLVGSRVIRESYVKRGFPADKILNGAYGIDTSLFPFIKRGPAENRPIRISVVGTIGFRKGIYRLLKIGEWAVRSGLQLEIHFAGPVLDPECNEMFVKSRAVCVRHGVIKGAALKQMLATCDLCALPSYEEGFGFSVMEAMSTGMAAIVSSVTGASQMIEHGASGLILSRFDDDEFDSKLAPLLKSPDRILAMGRAARARIESEYTLDHYCARIAKALEAVENLKNRKPEDR